MEVKITCLTNDSVGMEGRFWGEHGASYLVESGPTRILFDTGSSWEIIEHNLRELQMDLRGVSHIVLSHGHYDHTGGLLGVLAHTRRPTLIADPLIFGRKVSENPQTGVQHEIGLPHPRRKVEALAVLCLTEGALEIIPGISVTGRIPRVTDFEQSPAHMLAEIDGALQPDLLLDDRSMVIDLGEKLVLLCGCCHAGLINTLQYVDGLYHKPLAAIIGGIHLNGAQPERIQKTVQALRDHCQLEKMHFNHCTGLEATAALLNAFGERVEPCLVADQFVYR